MPVLAPFKHPVYYAEEMRAQWTLLNLGALQPCTIFFHFRAGVSLK